MPKPTPHPRYLITRVDYEKSFATESGQFSLDLNALGAHIAVIGGTTNTAYIRVQGLNEDLPDAALALPSIELSGDTLKVRARSLAPYLKNRGAMIIELVVPMQASIKLQCLAGSVWLQDLSGPLKVKLGAGCIEGRAITPAAKLKVGVGQITVNADLSPCSQTQVGLGRVHIYSSEKRREA